MRLGLIFSALLHALLLGWALVSFAKTAPMKLPEPEPVAVALITDADLVRLTKGDRDSKNLETAPAKKPDAEPTPKDAPKPTPRAAKPPAAAEPPPPPPEEKPPEPVKTADPPPPPAADPIASKLAALQKEPPPPPPPGPAPEELKRIEDEKKAEEARKLDQQKKAEEERKKAELAEQKRKNRLAEQRRKAEERKKKLAEAKRAEEERKKKFDPGRLAALLNKIPDKPQPAAGAETPTTRPLPKGPQAGAAEGKDTQLSAGKRSMIGMMMRDAVRNCWRVQTGLEGANQLVVEVEVRLSPDGAIDGQPRVVSQGSGPLYADASSRAIAALVGCAPYASLPKEYYKGGWDFMVVTFDPNKMF